MYTSHGHHITGTPIDDEQRKVSRCGGPGLCSLCSQEVASYVRSLSKPEKIPEGSFDEAIQIAKTYLSRQHHGRDINLDILSFSRAEDKVLLITLWPLRNRLLMLNYSINTKAATVSEFAWLQSTDI